ncbi:MAG: YkgJ family cysteine cluster protein [Acidobacteriota bacterium]
MRFECQPGCTKCCEQQGFVYLTEDDITRLANYLNLSAADFERRFVFRTKNLRRLRVPRHAQCEFLIGGGCGVHEVKPMQCRTFPFWPELLESRQAWHRAGALCPGIGKGELVNIENARATAEVMRAAHPHLY